MIFRKITNYRNDKYYLFTDLKRNIICTIAPQIMNYSNQPHFLVSYIVVDSDNKGTVMTMAVQKLRGMSNEELIEEVTGKIIRYCRTNNVTVYGKR